MSRTGRPSMVRQTVAALALVLLVLTSCGSGEEKDQIRLQANAVGGGQVYYEDLAAQDTVLWFWAPW